MVEDNELKNLVKWSLIISLVILIITTIIYIVNGRIKFDQDLNSDFFAAYATFAGTFISVVISVTSLILIYQTFKSQQELTIKQNKALDREYLTYKDSIRPVIEMKFKTSYTKDYGDIIFIIKSNDAYNISVTELKRNYRISPFPLNLSYFNKDNPLLFNYRKIDGTESGKLNLKFNMKIRYTIDTSRHFPRFSILAL